MTLEFSHAREWPKVISPGHYSEFSSGVLAREGVPVEGRGALHKYLDYQHICQFGGPTNGADR